MNKKLIALILIACVLFAVFVFAKPASKYGKEMTIQKKPLSTTSKYAKAKQAFDEAKYKAQKKVLPITPKYAKQPLAYNNLKQKMQKNDHSIFHKPWKPKTLLKKNFWFFDKEKKKVIEIPLEIYYIDENSFRFKLLKKVEDEEAVIMHLFSNSPTYVSRASGCEAYYYPMDNGHLDYCVKHCNTSSTWTCSSSSVGMEEYSILGFSVEKMCSHCSVRQQALNTYYSLCNQYFGDPFYDSSTGDTYCGLIYGHGIDGSCSPCWDASRHNPSGGYIVRCMYSEKNNCGSGGCIPSECNEQDYYGSYEYYCSGNDKRKHRRFYNYACGSNGCYLQSSNYENRSSLVERCSHGCSNRECNSAPSIECHSDSDCGSNGYTGSTFCKYNDVYQKYKTFDCRNAGTSNADCRSSTSDRKREDCEHDCSGGSCNSAPQDIECHNNSDCGSNGYIDDPFCRHNDVYQEYESYICHNAGTQNSYCSSPVTDKKKEECGSQGCTDGTCNITFAECTSGICCNIQAGTFKHSNEVCSTSFNYYCEGNKVMKRTTKKHCSGNSEECNGSTSQSSSLVRTCSGNQVCSNGECITQAPSNYCSGSDDWAPSWCSNIDKVYEDSENVEYKQSFKWNNSHLNAFKALNSDYQWELKRDSDYWDYWQVIDRPGPINNCYGNYWTNLPQPHTDEFSEEDDFTDFINTFECPGAGLTSPDGWAFWTIFKADEEFEVKSLSPQNLQANKKYWVKASFWRKDPGHNMTIHTESEYCNHNQYYVGLCGYPFEFKFDYDEMVQKNVVS